MASPDNLSDVESKRRELELNVSKLRASLRHWQQWEIEYEGMVGRESFTGLLFNTSLKMITSLMGLVSCSSVVLCSLEYKIFDSETMIQRERLSAIVC